MKGKDFLRDKLVFLALNLFTAGFGALLLWTENAHLLVIPAVFLLLCFLSLLSEYLTKNNYYRIATEISEQLEKKYLLSEIIDRPEFCEGKILYDLLKQTGKSMNDEIAKYSAASLEYREYIEIWVHEIKTPIAGAKLICENTGDKEALAELEKIERFVEQALF
jgi:signal transduction histidine kinase